MRPGPKFAVGEIRGWRARVFCRAVREGMCDLLVNTLNGSADGLHPAVFIGSQLREGSGVHEPVGILGLGANRYGLREGATVDFDELTVLVGTGIYGSMVLIRYFSRTVGEVSENRQCTTNGTPSSWRPWLVIPSSTTGRGGVGRRADIKLSLLHKTFPVPISRMSRCRGGILASKQLSNSLNQPLRSIPYDWHPVTARRRTDFRSLTRPLQRLPQCSNRFASWRPR